MFKSNKFDIFKLKNHDFGEIFRMYLLLGRFTRILGLRGYQLLGDGKKEIEKIF